VPDSIFDKFNSNKIRDLKLIHDFDGHIHASYYDNCPSQVTRGRNVSLIAFITAYARIHLHRHLSKIDYNNLLYCDTDSMYMVCNKGSPDPFQTSKLITGYFKLEHIGMKQWYALAPKMYALGAGYAYAMTAKAPAPLSAGYAYALGAGSDKVYADGRSPIKDESSNSVYAMSADTVYVRAKGFRVNKGFLDKSNFEGLLPTKENVYNFFKGLIDGDINQCSIRQTCLRGQRNGNIAVTNDYVKVLKSLQFLSHKRVINEDGSTSPIIIENNVVVDRAFGVAGVLPL